MKAKIVKPLVVKETPDDTKKPSITHFKPGWLLTVAIVVLTVGIFTFLVASRLNASATVAQLQENVAGAKQAIKNNCVARNEQIKRVNAKFEQLVLLFDTSARQRAPGDPGPPEDLLRLYEEFRKPIQLFEC